MYIPHLYNLANIYIPPSLSKLVTKMEMSFFVTIYQYLMVIDLIFISIFFPAPQSLQKREYFTQRMNNFVA